MAELDSSASRRPARIFSARAGRSGWMGFRWPCLLLEGRLAAAADRLADQRDHWPRRVTAMASAQAAIRATVVSEGERSPVPYIELNLAPTAEDMPEMAGALVRAIIAAAGKDRDEMTVLLIHGEPAAVIAPYGHDRRPGAAAGIRFDQTAPPEDAPCSPIRGAEASA
jgi:hypothetical protein